MKNRFEILKKMAGPLCFLLLFFLFSCGMQKNNGALSFKLSPELLQDLTDGESEEDSLCILEILVEKSDTKEVLFQSQNKISFDSLKTGQLFSVENLPVATSLDLSVYLYLNEKIIYQALQTNVLLNEADNQIEMSLKKNQVSVEEISFDKEVIDYSDVTEASVVEVTVTGSNFYLAESIKVKASNEIKEAECKIDLSGFTKDTKSFTCQLPLSFSTGKYTVTVEVDETAMPLTGTFTIYDDYVFNIPSPSVAFRGQTVKVTLSGKNFTEDNVENYKLCCLDMNDNWNCVPSVTGGKNEMNFTVESDTLLSAEITVPESAATYFLAASIGDKVITGYFIVTSYEVGDIVLQDGSKVSVTDVSSYTVDATNPPVGVVAVTDYGEGKKTLLLGLERSERELSWASANTEGCSLYFTETNTTGKDDGDTDGSDNWQEICKVDTSAAENEASNYPAFYFANHYGQAKGYSGIWQEDWYMPSASELLYIYGNKDTVQASLTAAGGFTFGSVNYWASNQYTNEDINYGAEVYFYNGTCSGFSKNTHMYVMVVRLL